MLEMFQSPSAADRLSAASAFLERFAPDAEVLIVCPSRDVADELARQVMAATRRATFGLHRASLTQLAVRFAAEEMARLAVAPATALGAEAVAAGVSFEALREQARVLRAGCAIPGLCARARGDLAELRLGRVAPGALAALDGPTRDVAELAGRFERQLDEAKGRCRVTASFGGRMEFLTRMVRKLRLCSGRTVVVPQQPAYREKSLRAFRAGHLNAQTRTLSSSQPV